MTYHPSYTSHTGACSNPDRQSRFVGCLIGGAVGDALGYPVEFLSEQAIFSQYGSSGIRTLPVPALISDDTQMTLFTAAAQLHALAQGRPAAASDLFLGYREWLGTQGDTSRMENPGRPVLPIYHRKELHSCRAPGNTCLHAISTSLHGGTPEIPVNNSKGCGGIMRVAPIGLAGSAYADPEYAVRLAAEAAALTHGHPMGFLSAALFAAIIQDILLPDSARLRLHQVIRQSIQKVRNQFSAFADTNDLCRMTEFAISLAQDSSVPDLDGLHRLGEGWVGEEALYIAVFSAVRHETDFGEAMRCAVNHRGDSDSTGAITGNILGARLGIHAVTSAFPLTHLELADLIRDTALDLESASRQASPQKQTAALPDYAIGSIVFGDWTIMEELGSGAFGSVYRLEKDGFGFKTTSALKVIRVPRSTSDIRSILSEGMDEHSATRYFRGVVEDIIKEISVLSSLKGHPGIVSYEDHRIIEHPGAIGWDIQIRMELLTSLVDYQRKTPLSEDAVRELAIQLCDALAYCQKKNMIHRDIKPENIFVSESGQFKLGDFGVARTADRTSGMSKKGTEVYMAPEVYMAKPYNASVDVYSLGLVLFRLCNNNRLPFFPPYPQQITFVDRENALMKRMQGVPLPKPANAGPALWAVIQKACAYDPKDRYHSAAEMLQALQNPVTPPHKPADVNEPPLTPPKAADPEPEQPEPSKVLPFPAGPEGFVKEQPIEMRGSVPVFLYRHNLTDETASRLQQIIRPGIGKGEIWVTHRFPLASLPLTITVAGSGILHFAPPDSKQLLSKLIPSGGHMIVRCVYPALAGHVDEITVHMTETRGKQLQYGQLDGLTNLVYVHNTNGKSCVQFNEIEKFKPVQGVFTSFGAVNCFYPFRSELFRPRSLWITSAIGNQPIRVQVQSDQRGYLNIPSLVRSGEPNAPLATACLLTPVKVNGQLSLEPAGICYQIKLEVASSICAVWDRSADRIYWAENIHDAQRGMYFSTPARHAVLTSPADHTFKLPNPFLRFIQPQ